MAVSARTVRRPAANDEPDANALRRHGGAILEQVNALQQFNRRILEKLRPKGKPAAVRFPVYTCPTFGNAVFLPEATVVSHELTRTEALDTGLGMTRLWPEVEWGGVSVEPATSAM